MTLPITDEGIAALEAAREKATLGEQVITCFVTEHGAIPALIARIRAAEEWQPIETAPKDGARFLGYGRHGEKPHPGAGKGVEPGDHWWGIIGWDVWRPNHIWVFSKDGAPTWSEPTHWRPLPAPPKAAP